MKLKLGKQINVKYKCLSYGIVNLYVHLNQFVPIDWAITVLIDIPIDKTMNDNIKEIKASTKLTPTDIYKL